MKGIKLLCSLMMLAGMSISGLAQADVNHGRMGGWRSDHSQGRLGGFARPDRDHGHMNRFTRPDHGRGNGFIRPDHGHAGGFVRHHERNQIFLFIEPYRPTYYPPNPAVVVIQAEPPVYIERESTQPEAATQESNYWYHCDQPEGYYPDVNECPGGWQTVYPLQP